MGVITYYSSLALSLLADSKKEKQQERQQEGISQKRDTKKSKRGSIKK